MVVSAESTFVFVADTYSFKRKSNSCASIKSSGEKKIKSVD